MIVFLWFLLKIYTKTIFIQKKISNQKKFLFKKKISIQKKFLIKKNLFLLGLIDGNFQD